MSHGRFRLLFILLVLILLMASAVFGVLTYWLGSQPGPVSAPGDARTPTARGLASEWHEGQGAESRQELSGPARSA